MNSSHNHSCAAIAAVVLALACGMSFAESYPARPVRLILPYPPGGASDIQGRALAQQLGEQLGKTVIADNRPGAGGNFGLEIAAKSRPDGYTIVLSSPTVAISPSLYHRMNYNSDTDLMPVARTTTIENVLIVHPSVPAKSLKELLELARNHRGGLNFGSSGPGSATHLASEMLQQITKIKMVHVPYKGGTRAAVALISGEVDEAILPVPVGIPYIQAGKVRPLAVLSRERVPQLPDVPTGIEAGYKDLQMSLWYGIFAPHGTPRDIVMRLNQEITKALNSPALNERLVKLGIQPWPGSPEDFASLVRSERKRYAQLIQVVGIRKH